MAEEENFKAQAARLEEEIRLARDEVLAAQAREQQALLQLENFEAQLAATTDLPCGPGRSLRNPAAHCLEAHRVPACGSAPAHGEPLGLSAFEHPGCAISSTSVNVH